MSDQTTRTPMPNPDLKAFDRLVGTWSLGGDTEGTISYEWMEGGFFLIQHVDMRLFGKTVKAVEIIGHQQSFSEDPSKDIHSRAYDTEGNTLDYIYEMNGDTLTIWGGKKGSSAYFSGVFSNPDYNEGEWIYPGGGYKSTMTRMKVSK